jgi:spore coat protein U-like protein
MKYWFALLPCVLFGGHAWGQTCTVSATAMAFGNTYQPLVGTALATTSTVTITCNPGLIVINLTPVVTLGPGGSGSQTARRMSTTTTPVRNLTYQIYKDTGHTQIWGDGTGGTFTNSTTIGLGLIFPITQTYTAYGYILPNTPGSVGVYSDMVQVIVTY